MLWYALRGQAGPLLQAKLRCPGWIFALLAATARHPVPPPGLGLALASDHEPRSAGALPARRRLKQDRNPCPAFPPHTFIIVPWTLNSQDSLARLARQIRPGSRVLDLGAGPGVLGRYLTEALDCTVDGVEYNPVAVAEAASWYRQLECADLESIALTERFAGQRYDFILCADILEHLRQPGALLAPGARPAGSERTGAAVGAERGLCRADRRTAGWRFPLPAEGIARRNPSTLFTHDSLRRLLEAHGLRAIAWKRRSWI